MEYATRPAVSSLFPEDVRDRMDIEGYASNNVPKTMMHEGKKAVFMNQVEGSGLNDKSVTLLEKPSADALEVECQVDYPGY